MEKILLIVNTGTPDSPSKRDVRRYLTEFLNDHRVINLPWILRKILVNLIIIPFRLKFSAERYSELWTGKGSPLKIYLENLVAKLSRKLEGRCEVIGVMRYGNPSVIEAIKSLKGKNVRELIIFPLFPQYASSTTGSIFEVISKEISNWEIIPAVRFVDQYYRHPAFIDAFASCISKHDPESFDHVLFSYHSLPLSQIRNIHPQYDPEQCECMNEIPDHGEYCYKATCYATTRLLASRLDLKRDFYSTSFQSRLTRNWLSPFTEKVLEELPGMGCKNVLVIAPSFVADCLET
ncbi:MAG: ferrochelatase, partial [Bacteroidales bacterium]|nr:ferrochelatase [Bacteroidales bacterium]